MGHRFHKQEARRLGMSLEFLLRSLLTSCAVAKKQARVSEIRADPGSTSYSLAIQTSSQLVAYDEGLIKTAKQASANAHLLSV